jgi:hypothetical protein
MSGPSILVAGATGNLGGLKALRTQGAAVTALVRPGTADPMPACAGALSRPSLDHGAGRARGRSDRGDALSRRTGAPTD